jgi:RNA polymerase sigma-70 factor (ECF subfamily)
MRHQATAHEAARNADVEAFEAAALPHLSALFRTAAHVIRDRSVAEDLVQETYYQAWKSFHRFERGTNCRAWLFKILFHVIGHHRRRWASHDRLCVADTERPLEQLAVYEPPTPERLSDEEILSALARIPGIYREVVLLVDVEGFSYREAADALSIPQGTVMSRLSRGRRALRTALADVAAAYGFARARAPRAVLPAPVAAAAT